MKPQAHIEVNLRHKMKPQAHGYIVHALRPYNTVFRQIKEVYLLYKHELHSKKPVHLVQSTLCLSQLALPRMQPFGQ